MMKNIRLFLVRFAPLLLILAFATTQFILIFRHKSPYLSDSYFYKHIFYEIKGDSFDVAFKNIISQVDLTGADDITLNFFTKDEAYKNSLSFFVKRPFYPTSAAFISLFISNEFIAFVVPIFAAYFASIVFSFYFFKQGLSDFFAIFATALLISFHPFLDWSTYFLTDTIGFAFWLLLLFQIYRYIIKGGNRLLVFFSGSLAISLLNREQSLLILPLLMILSLLIISFKFRKTEVKRGLGLILTTLTVAGFYFLASKLTNQRTLLEAIVYTQNSYGVFQREFSSTETLVYLVDAIKRSHIAFIGDLTRNHWWFVFFVLGTIGIVKTLLFDSKKRFIDLLMFSSGMASYISIFLYPVLSYRFFFPVVVTVIYFGSKSISDFFQTKNYTHK